MMKMVMISISKELRNRIREVKKTYETTYNGILSRYMDAFSMDEVMLRKIEKNNPDVKPVSRLKRNKSSKRNPATPDDDDSVYIKDKDGNLVQVESDDDMKAKHAVNRERYRKERDSHSRERDGIDRMISNIDSSLILDGDEDSD